jgi:hypothetical protein
MVARVFRIQSRIRFTSRSHRVDGCPKLTSLVRTAGRLQACKALGAFQSRIMRSLIPSLLSHNSNLLFFVEEWLLDRKCQCHGTELTIIKRRTHQGTQGIVPHHMRLVLKSAVANQWNSLLLHFRQCRSIQTLRRLEINQFRNAQANKINGVGPKASQTHKSICFWSILQPR